MVNFLKENISLQYTTIKDPENNTDILFYYAYPICGILQCPTKRLNIFTAGSGVLKQPYLSLVQFPGDIKRASPGSIFK